MTLRASNISMAHGRRTVLRDFSLTVAAGEIRALIGPNGSGKSTALAALAGLIAPLSGDVELEGKPMRAMTRRQIARRLAFLPQQPAAPDEMTVAELVRQGRFAHLGLFGSHGAADDAAIAWALEATGLHALAERGLAALSGGERQRAWIAAALAQEARVLLLDEPTTFLDIGYQIEVLELVQRLSRERGVAVVMAIHDLNQALSVCDRVSLLDAGRLVFDGEPAGLVGTDSIERVFRVRGRFVELLPGAAPHFDVQIARRPMPGR